MQNFTDDYFQQLLDLNQLGDFEDLWQLQIDLVELGNERRGGWSHVARLELQDEEGGTQSFYMKRQFNHNSRSFNAPLGEPTFAREYRNIERYEERGIGAIEAVYYQRRSIDGKDAAILITRALDDFCPLSDYWNHWSSEAGSDVLALTADQKSQLLDAVATAIGRLHKHRLSHNCLYPRHMYVRPASEGFDVRFIDLEKARYQTLHRRESIADLDAFLRRSRVLNEQELKQLHTTYLAVSELPISAPRLAQRLARRADSKLGVG